MRENPVPTVERMLLVLPALLFGHLAERCAEDRFFTRRFRGISSVRHRRGLQRGIAPRDALQKAGEIFLLLDRKTVHRLDRD